MLNEFNLMKTRCLVLTDDRHCVMEQCEVGAISIPHLGIASSGPVVSAASMG